MVLFALFLGVVQGHFSSDTILIKNKFFSAQKDVKYRVFTNFAATLTITSFNFDTLSHINYFFAVILVFTIAITGYLIKRFYDISKPHVL